MAIKIETLGEILGKDPSFRPLGTLRFQDLVREVFAELETGQDKPQEGTNGSVRGAHPLRDSFNLPPIPML